MRQGLTKRSLAAAAGTAALAIGISACGGDGGGGTDGVAGAAPADSAVYVELAAKPSEEQTTAIETIAAKFPNGQDIGAQLTEQLNESIAEDNPDSSFESDIEPWLGDRAGVFFLNFNDEADGAVIVETTDEDATREAIEKGEGGDPETKDVGGEDAIVQKDGDVSVITDGRLIAGTEAGVEAALKAASGDEDSLGGESSFSDSQERVAGEDALAYVQADIETAIAQAEESGSTDVAQLKSLLDQSGIDPSGTVGMSIDAEGDAIRSEFSVPFDAPGDATSPGLVGDLPGDSIVAFGSGDVGEAFSQGFNAGIEQSGEDAGAVSSQIESQLGIDPTELGEVFGAGGFYVRGTTVANLQAGALLEVTDTAKVQQALSSAKSSLGASAGALNIAGADEALSIPPTQGLNGPIEIALSGDRLAVSYGAGSAAETLQPSQPLSSSQTLSAASSALEGDSDPGLFVDIQGGLALLESAGAFQDEPDYTQVKPYLAPLGTIASAVSGEEDGNLVSALVLTFAQ